MLSEAAGLCSCVLQKIWKLHKIQRKHVMPNSFFNKFADIQPSIYRNSRSRMFVKTGVLKNSQYKQSETLLTIDFNVIVFLWILPIFKNNFIYRTPPVAAFDLDWKGHSEVQVYSCELYKVFQISFLFFSCLCSLSYK